MSVAKGLGSQVGGIRVCRQSLLGCQILLIGLGVLCNVSVVVSLHLVEEHFDAISLRVRDQVVIEQLKDALANAGQFLFNLKFVVFHLLNVVLVAYDRWLVINTILTLVVFFLLDG